MIRTISYVSLAVFALVSFSGTLATSPASAAQKNNACADDFSKYCPDKRGRDKRVCVKENEAKFTPACRDLIQQARTAIEQYQKACDKDQRKFCKGIKTTGGALQKCMNSNKEKMSDDCKTYLNKSAKPKE